MTGHQFKKKSAEKEEEADTGWWRWWKKRWPVLGKVQVREDEEEEKFPSKGYEDDPVGADKNSDKIF